MSNDEVWAAYAEEGYDVLLQVEPYRRLLLEVVDRSNIQDGMEVLDLCCGTGNLLLALHEKGIRCRVLGVDNEHAMLARAEAKAQKYRRFGGRAAFVRADVDTQIMTLHRTAPSGLFQRIACINGLYTLADPAISLLELATLASPGAIFVAATPRPNASPAAIFEAHLQLVKEGGGDPDQERQRLMPLLAPLFRRNDAILSRQDFHFPDEPELRGWYDYSGWHIADIQTTYAGHNWLVVAQRKGSK